MPRAWTPSPLLQATVAAHGAALAGSLAYPACWPWAVGGLVVNHAVLTVAGLLPRCGWLGPTLTRLPAAAAAAGQIALTIDDGPDPEVTPKVLDLLDSTNAKATFFCTGRRARQHPTVCRDIVNRGHRVENHGHSHSNAFSLFGPARMKTDIATAQAILSDITGQAPHFFRATAGLRNPFLEPVLAQFDLHLAAWTRRGFDTRQSRADIVLQRLSHRLAAGDVLLIHDGNAARTAAGQAVILEVLPRLLRTCAQHHLTPVTLAESCIE